MLDLSLNLSEIPAVHSTPILSSLTIPPPVEAPYAGNILQNYGLFSVQPPTRQSSLSRYEEYD
jgi:hypothetical protein